MPHKSLHFSRNFGTELGLLLFTVATALVFYWQVALYLDLAREGKPTKGIILRAEHSRDRNDPNRNEATRYSVETTARDIKFLNVQFPRNTLKVGDEVSILQIPRREDAVLAGPQNSFVDILNRELGPGHCMFLVLHLAVGLISGLAFLWFLVTGMLRSIRRISRKAAFPTES